MEEIDQGRRPRKGYGTEVKYRIWNNENTNICVQKNSKLFQMDSAPWKINIEIRYIDVGTICQPMNVVTR